MTMKKYKIAIVGATGAVGVEMLKCIYQFNFPFASIKLLASKRSAGKEIKYQNDSYIVEELTKDSFQDIDIAFWSAGGSISEEYIPYALKNNCINIDNTSHFRMDENVPLVVPEVNAEALKNHQGIIANPNCSTIQMVSALKQLDDKFNINRIVVSTYQAVSGAGVAGMSELFEQTNAIINEKEVVANTLPCASDKHHYQIAFNCIPQIDKFDLDTGYSKEELKMVNETKKIFNKEMDINVTCVRVPVLRGHSESVYIETNEIIDLKVAKNLLRNSTGVVLLDDIQNQVYPMPINTIGDEKVYVGRVRKDLNKDNALSLWVVADQLMKGAAYNSIDIGLKMIEMGLI